MRQPLRDPLEVLKYCQEDLFDLQIHDIPRLITKHYMASPGLLMEVPYVPCQCLEMAMSPDAILVTFMSILKYRNATLI